MWLCECALDVCVPVQARPPLVSEENKEKAASVVLSSAGGGSRQKKFWLHNAVSQKYFLKRGINKSVFC